MPLARHPPKTMSEPTAFDREVDARGLNCPLPILKAKKALAELGSGQVLKVVSTDPGSVRDFQAFARQTGNELLAHSQAGDALSFYLKRR
jgi:tRNA 2-thiouridine synthesizing protein A